MLKPICGIADGVAVLAETPNSSPPPGAQPLWGSHGAAGGGPGARPRPGAAVRLAGSPAGGQPLEPVSRRLLQVAGLLSVLLIAVVANSLLQSGENPFNPVAVAAEKAEKTAGARFSLYVVYSSPASPASVTASGSGVVNEQTERARATLDLNSPTTGAVHIVSISDGQYEYLSGDTVENLLPPGKKWIRTPSDSKDKENNTPDLEESLRMLSSSGGVDLIGREAINGRMTRRYRTAIDLGTFVALLRESDEDEMADAYERIEGISPTGVSAEAWVDRKNLLRRLRVVMPSPGKEGQPPLTVDMRMDIYAYGIHPDIQLPDPDSVVDGPLDSSSAAISAQAS